MIEAGLSPPRLMFRNIRTFSSLSRSLFRRGSPATQNDGLIHIRRIRIVRPFFTLKRAQTASLYIAGFAVYWHLLEPTDVGEEDEKKQHEQEHIHQQQHKHKPEAEVQQLVIGTATEENAAKVDNEKGDAKGVDDVIVPDIPPEDSWFIPLGLARQCPPTFYKGNDPEWQSFMQFSKDRNRSMSIRNELAGLVGGHLAEMRGFQNFLGVPINPAKYWLDIDFPEGPPPEYERGGIEITDDYVAWTIRPVNPINMSRLQRALFPIPIMSSVWASYSALWSLQMAKLKTFLNIKPSLDTQERKTPPSLIDFHRMAKTKETQQKDSGTGVEESLEAKASDAANSKQSSSATEADARKVPPLLPSLPQPTSELGSALTAFKQTLAKTWKPAAAPAPRGTFMVSGLVEVRGPKGVCVLDVRAAYHPAESRWVTIGMAVRRAQLRKQSPKG